MSKKDPIREQVQKFYDQRPYPPPVKDLDNYRQRWQDDIRQRSDFHLYWPHQPYRENISVLVAGCCTSQAARHALRNPAAQVVGIDLSSTSIQHTLELKRRYDLNNLEVRQLPVEQVGELGICFDRIEHSALVEKLSAIQPIAKLVRGWLKAGIVDDGKMLFPKAGTPQGSLC